MIFLDTNIFLRHFVDAASAEEFAFQELATQLFEAVERGDETVTSTEVVIHEVCYLLFSKQHYGVSAAETAAMVSSILSLPGFKLPKGEKQIYLDALELFAANPKLEFSDSVIAIRAHRLGIPLATFDRALLKLPIVTPWQPAGNGQT